MDCSIPPDVALVFESLISQAILFSAFLGYLLGLIQGNHWVHIVFRFLRRFIFRRRLKCEAA